MEKGVFYIATGSSYINEAIKSAKSLKLHNQLPVTIHSDEHIETPVFDKTEILPNPQYDFSDSLFTFESLPYDRTLFLDTDTYILGDITGIFSLLNHFDIAVAHNPYRNYCNKDESNADIPDSFPQFNTGVVAIRKNSATKKMLDEWNRLFYDKYSFNMDYNQPAFREAIYRSDVRIATLPPEYNYYFTYPSYAGGPVKILHANHDILYHYLEDIGDIVNKDSDPKTTALHDFPIEVTAEWQKKRSLKFKFKRFLRKKIKNINKRNPGHT